MSATIPTIENSQATLCDVLDGLLNKGVVAAASIVISVADVDLLYIDLQCLISSLQTAYGEKSI